jgi:hypothetical protein
MATKRKNKLGGEVDVAGAGERESPTWSVQQVLDQIENIEVTAVVGGAPQVITFLGGTNPAHIRPMLLTLDPNADIKAAFNRGGWSAREIKWAKIKVISVRTTDQWQFVDLSNDDVTIAVPNRLLAENERKASAFVSTLQALGKITPVRIARLAAWLKEKGSQMLILTENEWFEVEYSTSEEGKHYVEKILKGEIDGKRIS